MGRSMDRHRFANKNKAPEAYEDDIDIHGEAAAKAAKAAKAASVLDYVATGAKMGTEIAQGQAAAEKAAAEAKAQQEKQDAATNKRKEAEYARIDALSEKESNGPAHIKAAKLDLEATMLERAAGMGLVPSGAPAAQAPSSPSIFTTRNALIGLGVLGVIGAGFLGYKLVSGHHPMRGGR